MNRVIRACIEMGDSNPIVSIHDQGRQTDSQTVRQTDGPQNAPSLSCLIVDVFVIHNHHHRSYHHHHHHQYPSLTIPSPHLPPPLLTPPPPGAGGNGNVLKEIVDPHGARYELRKIPVGDPTLSAMEIWGAEYQENCAFLVAPEVPHTPPTQLTHPNHLIQTKPPPVQSNPTQITPPNSNPTQPKPPNPPNPTPAQLTLTHFFTTTYHHPRPPPPCPEPRDGAGSGQARALPRDPRGRGNGRRAGGARGLGCGCQRQPPHPLRPPPVARARQDAAEGQSTASVTTRRTFTTHIHYHRTMSCQHTPSTHPTRP